MITGPGTKFSLNTLALKIVVVPMLMGELYRAELSRGSEPSVVKRTVSPGKAESSVITVEV